MNKTLRLSFTIKNAYRVNSILYSLKQIPIIKKCLPQALYGMRGFKIFANVVSVIWELITTFLGKYLYFLTLVCGIGSLYENQLADRTFLHILLFLTIIGAYMNTSLFDPTRDKYYAMILMRMNAREYTIVNYGYAMLKVLVGFLPFTIVYGTGRGIPLWFCILIPFSVVGLKLAVSAYSLWEYEHNGYVYNENKIRKFLWLFAGILLVLAYGLPAMRIVLPKGISMAVMIVFVVAGMLSIPKLISFRYYYEINKELLSKVFHQMDDLKQIEKTNIEKKISADIHITSKRKGFEYLNELFVKRHQKILWKSTIRISAACCILIVAGLAALEWKTELKDPINKLIMNGLPYFAFIMYFLNRGTGFTQAVFMNCDHSLLTYSFFKQPKYVLKLFQIRLREIMKMNALPAVIIGIGLSLFLYVSGGTQNPMNYVIIIVSIVCMSMFFSIHYLTIYYLLQPYNAGTEIKSATYQIVCFVTYFVCYFMTKWKVDTFVFGIACIAFCVVYSIVACILVYRLAPKTFRLRT